MPTDEEKAQNKAQMDAAAKVARQDFMDDIVVNKGGWKEVCRWVLKHKDAAGYKRLGVVLKEIAETLGADKQASES